MSYILLADDDENLRPALQMTLESFGHKVLPARNGKEAFELFGQNAVDIIISDIRMPEMDGLELTRLVKSQRAVPVILITGFAEILETQLAHELGADEFLAKPFDRADLTAAVQRCANRLRGVEAEEENAFCRLALEDFSSGRQIQFNIFACLSDRKFVKIAHQGEDLSVFRIKAYRQKNVNYLYLRREDFRKYVGFALAQTNQPSKNNADSKQKRLALIHHTGQTLVELVRTSGLTEEMMDGAKTFVESAIEALTEDENVLTLLDSLNQHADYLYAHSLGVSLYSVVLARAVKWKLPTNSFKIATAGMLHEIGLKEVDRELLEKPRETWTEEETKRYETHPTRAVELLSHVESVHSDVLQIIKQHHENVRGQGFPLRLRRSAIHPMAKLVAVVDEFVDRVVKGPLGPALSPQEALLEMRSRCSDKVDLEFLGALERVYVPSGAANA